MSTLDENAPEASITVEIDGKEYDAVLATEAEIQAEAALLEAEGHELLVRCRPCGRRRCSSLGRWWVCQLARDNRCHWYVTRAGCNPGSPANADE